jgi:hypothetical protein
MGPATASAAGLESAEDQSRQRQRPGRSTSSGRRRRDPCGHCDPGRSTDSIREVAVRDQHPPGRAHNRIQLKNASYGRHATVNAACARCRPARSAPARRGADSGAHRPAFEAHPGSEAIQEGIRMMPITDRVQNQADDKTVQPSSNSSVNAAGTRLRRRLSKIFHRDSSESGFFRRLPSGPGTPRQQPARNLPIPANPAVPAAHVRAVAGRIFLVQLHIAQQPRPRVAPFQKIVAEDPVLGKRPLEGPLERIDIIDALADERAFAEQVLVNIGDGARIGIDARLASAHARIPRPVRPAGSRPPVAEGCRTPRDTLLVFVVPRRDSAGAPWRPQTAMPNRAAAAYPCPG